MGNCTQPSQSSDTENPTIPQVSFAKNSFLRRSQLQASNNLDSNMTVIVYIYSKCEGLPKSLTGSGGQSVSDSSTPSTQSTSPAATSASTLDSLQGKLMVNYTVKYGAQEYTWVEHNCANLHKSKKLSLNYRLGQTDQTVSRLHLF